MGPNADRGEGAADSRSFDGDGKLALAAGDSDASGESSDLGLAIIDYIDAEGTRNQYSEKRE